MRNSPIPTRASRLQAIRQGRSLAHARGQGLAEYALILGLVSVVVIVVLSLLGPAIGNTFSNVVGAIESPATGVADAGSPAGTGSESTGASGTSDTTGSTGTSGTGGDSTSETGGDTSGDTSGEDTSGGTVGTGDTTGGGTTIGAGSGGDTSGDTGEDSGAPDADGDGIADAEDNCPADANANQADSDSDGLGNVCDPTPNGDDDADGVDDLTDNCPGLANPDQADTDGDRLGDACDPTPNGDRDGDGVDDTTDNCPDTANGSQADTDGDGQGDICDPTPNGDPVAYYYNAGTTNGGTDSAGHDWQGIGTSGFTAADGRVRTTRIRSDIGGTSDDFIFERLAYATSGDLHWETSGLPDGTYTVRLYFADDDASSPSRFHINVQGGPLEVSGYSPVQASGASQAAIVTLSGVRVSGGTLTLDLIRVDNAPLISGIAISN